MNIEKIPGKDPQLDVFLKIYPLPELHKDKAELAWELNKILDSLFKKDSSANDFKNYTTVCNFAKQLREKYKKDASQYYLYNVIIGSSMVKSNKFDFEGDDSIEKYLRSQNI